MIKSKNKKTSGVEIDLTGPEGNAFVLMGYARNLAKQMSWTREESNQLLDRMMSGDYENLVSEFEKSFGDYVTLYR